MLFHALSVTCQGNFWKPFGAGTIAKMGLKQLVVKVVSAQKLLGMVLGILEFAQWRMHKSRLNHV